MIVAHHSDYKIFQRILSDSVIALQKDSKNRADYYLSRGGVNLEKDVYQFVDEYAKETVFNGNIELISGQKFPDIVAYVNKNQAYGIEVKTTKSNQWKSTGSSIFEGTRVEDVANIHLLFGKLSNPIEFKCRKYEECLYDVAITHSPRYLIDMNTRLDDTIFSKVGVEYNELRKLDNPFKPIKKYFRQQLNQDEDLWWIDNNTQKLSIELWGNLTTARKEVLRIISLAYFPVLLGENHKKYGQLATWLVSRYGVVNYALRDTFTAGGQIVINNIKFPKIYKHLTDDLPKIMETIRLVDADDMEHYWKVHLPIINPITTWKKQCLMHCKQNLNAEQYRLILRILSN